MQTKPILVTYASCTGYASGVAEAVARTLAATGLAVEVRRMQEVAELTPYGAVVAGSAIQGNKWLPEAMQFVQTHRAALAEKPFAVFLTCMALAMPGAERYRQGVAGWLEPVRRLVRPASEGLFAGGLTIGRVPSPIYRVLFRLIVILGIWREGDHRDWNAIRAWALSLKPLLTSGQGHAL